MPKSTQWLNRGRLPLEVPLARKAGLLIQIFLLLLLVTVPNAYAADEQDKMIERALMEYQRGNTPNALDLIYSALEKYPKNSRALDLYGQIRDDEAKRLCRAAEIYFRNGELDIARKKIEESRALSVDIFLAYIEEKVIEAKSFLADQDPIRSAESADGILFFDPGNNEALKLKALLKSSFFRELYGSVISEKKKLAARKYTEARQLSANPIKSLGLANEALKLDPSNNAAAKLRKQLLKKLAEEESSALGKSDKQMAKDKEKAMGYFLKAEESYKKKKFERAFRDFEKALARDPDMAQAKKMKEETGALIAASELALAFDSLASGKKRAASRHVKKARLYDPAMVSQKALEMMAEARRLMASGEKDRSAILFSQAALLNPEYEDDKRMSEPASELNEAWELYKGGNYERCADVISGAVKKYPENMEVLFLESLNSAQMSLDKGDFLQTREFLLRSVKLNPLHREVWDFFSRMDELLKILGYDIGEKIE